MSTRANEDKQNLLSMDMLRDSNSDIGVKAASLSSFWILGTCYKPLSLLHY